jgi:hypothetical protein
MRAGGVYSRMVTELICAPTTIRMGLHPGEILGGEFDFGPEIKRDACGYRLRWLKGASAVARFDVWQGERRIEGVAPTMRKGKPRR